MKQFLSILILLCALTSFAPPHPVSIGGSQVWTNDSGVIHLNDATLPIALGVPANISVGQNFYIEARDTNQYNFQQILELVGADAGNGGFLGFNIQANENAYGFKDTSFSYLFSSVNALAANGGVKALWDDHGAFALEGLTECNTLTNGQAVGVLGHSQGIYQLQGGVSGIAEPLINGQTNVGVYGAAILDGKTGTFAAGLFELPNSHNSNEPLIENAALIADSRATGYSEQLWRTNGNTTVASMQGGVLTSVAYVISGTTNQITFGSTNTAPVTPGTIVKWVSVQVQGENNVYRIPLYK